jgi:hypothetical protein
MSNPKPKIYVGCSLTQAPEEFKAFILEFKSRLREEGNEVMEFLGLVKGTPADVYEQDIMKCVSACDILIAVADYPAIGLGYEMAVAIEKLKIPALALARRGASVTRLINGIPHEKYAYKEYSDMDEMVNIASEYIKSSL